MKFFVILSSLLIFVSGESRHYGKLDFGHGKIIGGVDAPARKLLTL